MEVTSQRTLPVMLKEREDGVQEDQEQLIETWLNIVEDLPHEVHNSYFDHIILSAKLLSTFMSLFHKHMAFDVKAQIADATKDTEMECTQYTQYTQYTHPQELQRSLDWIQESLSISPRQLPQVRNHLGSCVCSRGCLILTPNTSRRPSHSFRQAPYRTEIPS